MTEQPKFVEVDGGYKPVISPIKATNLSTGVEVFYIGLTPQEAVRNAYAQYTMKDWNTWDYGYKYGHMVIEGQYSYACGDWCTLKVR